ncbi:MAG: tetratricopeptide repeat protein [Nostocaceae cyanobacterium]|nr:tetratricopeptide repeat protein [Nostocaceae cyanobacterium]
MANEKLLAIEGENLDAYDDLIVSIEAKPQGLNLLIAVCDDSRFRNLIISKYEAELQSSFRHYRVTLTKSEPSLKAAISQLITQEEYLKQHQPVLATVTGAEQLYSLKLEAERSQQDIFFGYLQWTREALREFNFPIVLWVNNEILINLVKKSPDFWSWRNGVFRFVAPPNLVTINVNIGSAISFDISELNNQIPSNIDNDKSALLSIEDLKNLIQQNEQRGVRDSSLATLYFNLADSYRKRLDQGKFQDYQAELALAIEYYRQAAELQIELGLQKDLASSYNNLAGLYDAMGRYDEAEPLYKQALELRKHLLGENHPSTATGYGNLAGLYHAMGRYDEAEQMYKQALELTKHLLGENHPSTATSHNNLALLYSSMGRYDEAEQMYKQALELTKHLLGENHPDTAQSYNNLALLYYAMGRYDEAEPLYKQALELTKHLLGENHPNTVTFRKNWEMFLKEKQQ